MIKRNNHVVSAGYLRYFAASKTIRLIELDGTLDKEVGVRDVFRERDFSVVRAGNEADDSLEREWERLETLALPRLRGLSLGYPLMPKEDASIKILVALHFARSYGVKKLADETWDVVMADFHRKLPDKRDDYIEAFRQDYGGDPLPGELEDLALRFTQGRKRSNVVWVGKQAEYYNRMLDFLRPLHTQVGLRACPERVHFIASDSPLVLMATRVVAAPGQGIGLGDADTFLMPLTKNVVASFTSSAEQPRAVFLNGDGVREINQHVSNAAMRFVVAWPHTDLGASAPWLPSRPSTDDASL